jgi:alpha-galactosidase
MGMLYYMPQFWTSDNTDAVSRLKIQYGTSLVYPPVCMGAHVSAVPNHQVGRSTPLETRANVAFGGVFGYELDISILGEEEKERIREQIAWYRMHRRLIQFGDFIRLASPFDSNEAAWMFLSERRDEVLVFHFTLLREANTAPNLLRVEGLPKGRKYREEESGRVYGSEELMYRGLPLPAARHDFDSRRVYLYEIQGRGSA